MFSPALLSSIVIGRLYPACSECQGAIARLAALVKEVTTASTYPPKAEDGV
jgi:hypothetical protein